MAAIVVSSCGGGSTYSLSQGNLAQRFLPTERSASHHPDSLVSVTIEEEEDHYTLDLKKDYEALHRKWSCTYQVIGTDRRRTGLSYATFWSHELSLASLEPEVGLSTLTKDQALQSIERRRKEYQSSIQIDVYWFEREGNSVLTGPGSYAELQIAGETYKPKSEDHGPLRETFLPGTANSALYRRNTFHFKRVVDSTDIIKDADKMTLVLRETGLGSRVRFVWSWPGGVRASGL